MIKLIITLFLTFNFSFVYAEDEVTTIDLKYINGEEVISVLQSLTDKSVSLSENNNMLIIKGADDKVKNLLPIIKEIDSAPTPLTIEFIASNRKINFNTTGNTYESSKNKSNTSQSMSITERQWVTLKTGLSVPIAERKRYADGTETQSFRYKKVSKSYVFKVHEFGGWSIIQIGMDSSELNNNPIGPIEHTKLDTTIVGKTGEWLEVASTKKIIPENKDDVYSTNRPNKKYIHLYVKVNKSKAINNEVIETEKK